jgi:4-amino-4-deoxychorismate lyase
MSRLIESIRLYDGAFSRLELHQARIDHSFRQIYKSNPKWQLETFLKNQEIPAQGLYKCRVVYDDELVEVEFTPYQAKTIQTLRLVEDNEIEYSHKWEDRDHLNKLFAMRGNCDDILIVKNGLITDTLYANIVFEKSGKWFTPQSRLLNGTMRQFLLQRGVIEEREISVDNFKDYERFKLINAMLEFDSPAVVLSNVN